MTPDRCFERTVRILGRAALARLAECRITLVGLGAVGSFFLEAAARTGIGHFRLIDFDRIEPSNINRQIFALQSTMGQNKTDLAEKRLKDINPWCRVEKINQRLNLDSAGLIPDPADDLLVDAIDDLPVKVELLAAARQRGVSVLASMGAARHRDPGAIECADISQTFACPVARHVRRGLRQRGIESGIRCVFSREPPDRCDTANPDADEVPGCNSKPPLGSLAQVTGSFGLRLAAEAIDLLLT